MTDTAIEQQKEQSVIVKENNPATEKYPHLAAAIDLFNNGIDKDRNGRVDGNELIGLKMGENISQTLIDYLPRKTGDEFIKIRNAACLFPSIAGDAIEKRLGDSFVVDPNAIKPSITPNSNMPQIVFEAAGGFNKAVGEGLGLSEGDAAKLIAANAKALAASSKDEIKLNAELLAIAQDPEGAKDLLTRHPINLKLEKGALSKLIIDECKAPQASPPPTPAAPVIVPKGTGAAVS